MRGGRLTGLVVCLLGAAVTSAWAQTNMLSPTNPILLTFDGQPNVLDLNDALCPDRCPAVLDDVLVYRRGSHLTVTAVGVLTPLLGQRLLALPAAGGLLDGG